MFGTPLHWGGGELYRGKINIDKDGNKCIPWRDYLNKTGKWPDFLKTEEMRKNKLGDKDGSHDYCRNPDKSDTLWCYTKGFKKGKCQMKNVINEQNVHGCVKINTGWDGGKVFSISKESGKREWIDINQVEASKIVPFTKNKWQDCLRQCNANKECSGFTFGNYTQQTCHKGKDNKCNCILYKGGRLSKTKTAGMLGGDAKCIKKKRLYSDINANFHAGFSGLCQCQNGKPAEGIECPKDGAFKCASCSFGYKLKDGLCIVDDVFLKDIRDNKLISSKKRGVIEVDRGPQVSTYSGGELINILQGRISESKSKVRVIEQETVMSKAKIDKLSTMEKKLEKDIKYKEDIQRKEITRVSQILIDTTRDIENIGILHNNKVSQMISDHRNNIYKMENDFKLVIGNLKKETKSKADEMIESYKDKMEQDNYDSASAMRRYLNLNVIPTLNTLKTGAADMDRRVTLAGKLKEGAESREGDAVTALAEMRTAKRKLVSTESTAAGRVAVLNKLITGETDAKKRLTSLKGQFDDRIAKLQTAVGHANEALENKRDGFNIKLKAQRETLLAEIIKYTGSRSQLDLAALKVSSISFDWVLWNRLKQDPDMADEPQYVRDAYTSFILHPGNRENDPELLINGESKSQTDIIYNVTAPVETIEFKMNIKAYPNVTEIRVKNLAAVGLGVKFTRNTRDGVGGTFSHPNDTAFKLNSIKTSFTVTVTYLFNGQSKELVINVTVNVRASALEARAWRSCRCETNRGSGSNSPEPKTPYNCRELYKGRKFEKGKKLTSWPNSNLLTSGAPLITFHGEHAYGPTPGSPESDLTNQDFPPCNRSELIPTNLCHLNASATLGSLLQPEPGSDYWEKYKDSILDIFSQTSGQSISKNIRNLEPELDEPYQVRGELRTTTVASFNPPTAVTNCKSQAAAEMWPPMELDNGWVQHWFGLLNIAQAGRFGRYQSDDQPWNSMKGAYWIKRHPNKALDDEGVRIYKWKYDRSEVGQRAEERDPGWGKKWCLDGCWDYTRDVQGDAGGASAESKAISVAKEYCKNHVKCGGFNIHSTYNSNNRKHICFLKANDNGLTQIPNNLSSWLDRTRKDHTDGRSHHTCTKGYRHNNVNDGPYSDAGGQYTCEYGIKANYDWGNHNASACTGYPEVKNKHIGICTYVANQNNIWELWESPSDAQAGGSNPQWVPRGTTPGVAPRDVKNRKGATLKPLTSTNHYC